VVAELTMARRLSLADLDATRQSFPAEVRADKGREIFTLAVSIVRHFFGHDWYMEHVFQDADGSRPDGFMRIDYTPGPKGETKTSRLLDFAENLFNLQHIDGFDDRVEQMRTGSTEGTFAEFDFGRFLYIHDIDFKFVTPCGVAGKDFDYRVRYADGREVCADAKCRLEATDMRAETIINALRKARTNNLPPDEPGAVFVKVPPSWLESETVRRGIYATVALTRAIVYGQALGISLQDLRCVQIPHHGSRRNVSPSVLNAITAQVALVSVAPKSTTHPRRKVTNAFKRRGARVYRTNGTLLNYTINWPRRPDISDAPEIPFYDRVEA
jgi:hypothetical protein